MKNIKQLFIITGVSKGLGKSILERVLSNKDNIVLGISRSNNPIDRENHIYLQLDLSSLNFTKIVKSKVEFILDQHKGISDIILINNAAKLNYIDHGWKIPIEDTLNIFNLNLIAPVLLQNILINVSFECNKYIEIVNILSGAALKPYIGWSTYCSSKSALNMYSKVVAKEIDYYKKNVKIWELLPYVMDTDMQDLIRSEASIDAFPDLNRFIRFKQDNSLLSTEIVADKILSLVKSQLILNGNTYDIRDLFLENYE